MYYIFDNKAEALQYDADVTAASNFPKNDNYANPKKHPSKELWAILASNRFVIEGKDPQELTEDWKPEIEEK